MKIQELYDIDKEIKVNGLKEVTSAQIYKSQNLSAFNPNGLFSEEIFGQTIDERKYTMGYIKLPIHIFNPDIGKNVIQRSGGIIRKVAYGEVRCNLVNGVLVADKEGQYCGLKDLYNIWDEIDISKTLNTRSQYIVDILTKSPKRLIFNDKILVLPPELRKIGTRNGKQVKNELNSMYIHIINMKSVLSQTTSNSAYQLWNKFQDAAINIATFITNYVGGKNGFFQRQLLAKNTTFTARNVISAPRYNTDESPIGIFRTGYPLHTCCTLFNPLVKFHMKQFFSFSNIQSIHPNPNEINPQELRNIYDDKMIDDLLRIYMHNANSRFRIMYLDSANQVPLQMQYFDVTSNQAVTRPVTLTDVCYLCAKAAIVDADRTVYTVRYPIGDYLGAFFTKVHILSTLKTSTIQFRGEEYTSYPVIDFNMDHGRIATAFCDTLTPSNSRLKAIGGDYDGDTVKSTGIWSDEANEQATKLMYSKVYNITPQCTTPFEIAIECLSGLYALTKKPQELNS